MKLQPSENNTNQWDLFNWLENKYKSKGPTVDEPPTEDEEERRWRAIGTSVEDILDTFMVARQVLLNGGVIKMYCPYSYACREARDPNTFANLWRSGWKPWDDLRRATRERLRGTVWDGIVRERVLHIDDHTPNC